MARRVSFAAVALLGSLASSSMALAAPATQVGAAPITLQVPRHGVQQQQIIGVGMALNLADDKVTVQELVPDSPVSRDGSIKVGDMIVAVKTAESAEWQTVAGLGLPQVVALIRGQAGTEVGLRMQRAGDGADHDIFLTRELLKLPSHPAVAKLPVQAP